jgi:predicted Zn-dependent protease
MKAGQLVVLLFLVASSTVIADEPRITRASYNPFTDDEEVAVGKKASEEVERTRPILHDPILDAYLNRVGQMVARGSRRPKLQYHFTIVDKPDINAFSLPGGFIYVNRGFFDFVDNESELAAVLSHEVGHVVGYHGINEFARRLILDNLLEKGRKAGVLKGPEADSILQRAGGALLMFVDLKFSREQETEADLLGLYNMVRARWTPSGAITVLSRIEKPDNTGLLDKLLSTHPFPVDRLRTLSEELSKGPSSGKLSENSLLFTAAKARLHMLPPLDK